MKDANLSSAAVAKLEELLRTHSDATVAGVVVRTGIDIITVTKEGRVQWFKQDSLGGIKREPDPPKLRFLDRMKNARR